MGRGAGGRGAAGRAAGAENIGEAASRIIGGAFTMRDFNVSDVRSVQYRRRGEDRLVVEDIDGALGNMYSQITDRNLQRSGITMDQLVDYLDRNGARRMPRTRRR